MQKPLFLAQVAHFFVSYAVMLTAVMLILAIDLPLYYVLIVFGVCTVGVAIKEFVYDKRYERNPAQTWADCIMDFGICFMGGVTGVGVGSMVFLVAVASQQ